jgi:PRC-barrel domain
VNDEKLGTIDDVIFDHSSGDIRYIVLKTGGLLSRKKVMVPANRVEPYGNHEDKFYAELDKERLEMLPEFNDETLKSEDWSKFEKDYEQHWSDAAVIMNPIGEEIEIPREASTISSAERMREPGVYKLDPAAETEPGLAPGRLKNENQGRRWNVFQEMLRSGRHKIVVDCPRCASQEKAA